MSAAAPQHAAAAIRGIAGLALLGVGCVGLWQILDDKDAPDATTLGLLVIAIAAFAAMLQPKPFAAGLGRVKSLDLFGVKVEVEVERARRIALGFHVAEGGVKVAPRPPGDTPAHDVDNVANELRRKVRFVRKAVLGDPDSLGEELVVAQLEYLGLLEREEAHLCHEVMGELRDTIKDWDATERDTFLDQAWTFAVRFASEMFDRHARRRLREDGWFVADYQQNPGHRPDFLVKHDREWALVAARVASSSDMIDKTIRRLVRLEAPIPGVRRIMVVPDHVDHLPPEIDDGPVLHADGAVMMVRLHHLLHHP